MSNKKVKTRVGASVAAGSVVGVGLLLLLFGMIINLTDETAGTIIALIGLGLIIYAIAIMRK